MSQVLCFSLVLGLAGQPPPKREDSSGHTERLEIMTKSMVHTQVRADDAREESYRLRPEPILRFTKALGDGGKDVFRAPKALGSRGPSC